MNFIDENGTEWTFDKEFGLGVKAPELMREEKEEKIKLYIVRLNRLLKQLDTLEADKNTLPEELEFYKKEILIAIRTIHRLGGFELKECVEEIPPFEKLEPIPTNKLM